VARRRKRKLLARMLAPVRLNWYRAVRSDEGSRYLAGGLALGVFIAAFPLSFFHFPISWFLAGLVRVSKSASTAGVMLSNPLTIVPIFVFTTWIGLAVTPGGEQSAMLHPLALAEDPDLWSKLAWSDVSIIVIGAVTVGVVAGTITYVLALRWIASWGARRASYRRAGSESV
jgi:uncharacterized protein (DUF2062 family)